MSEKPTKNMNCFAPTGEPDHPLRPIVLLYDQTGERISALRAIWNRMKLRGSAAPASTIRKNTPGEGLKTENASS